MKILITDGEERAALAATRSLGRADSVHVAAATEVSLAGASRWASARHVVPDALASPEAFRAAIVELVAAHRIDAVLPIADRTCLALALDPAALEPARLLAPPLAVYRRLSDKHAVAELAARHGIASPEGVLVASADEAVDAARRLDWPAVVKPLVSVSHEEGAPGRSLAVSVVDDEAALRACWSRDVRNASALVQRCVPGWGEGLFILRCGGRTLAASAHRRLREKPPAGGVSVLRESIAVDPDLRTRVEALLDEAGFEGVAMAEFRTDGRDRWLMEFNVRLWGSLQLAIDAGVDFPRLLVDALAGADGVAGPAPAPRVGVRSRWLLGDVDHAIALMRGQVDTRGRSGVAAALRVLFGPAGPHARFEVLRRDDPRPFAVEIRRWLRDALGGPRLSAGARAPAVDPLP